MGNPLFNDAGCTEEDIEIVGELIVDVLNNPSDKAVRDQVATTVDDLCSEFSIYADTPR